MSVDELVEARVEEWGLGARFRVSPPGVGQQKSSWRWEGALCLCPKAQEGKVGGMEDGGWEPDADRALWIRSNQWGPLGLAF